MLNAAIAAFQQGDYDGALDIVVRALTKYPSDAVLHEFRALVLFAKGDYQQAAAVLHSVLAVGPGWDWTTMSRLYTDASVYTGQLRALEAFIRANPQDAAARFVLAYHYITAGHADAAAQQLTQVTQLVSGDKVAADLLRMLQPKAVAQGSPGGPSPSPMPPAESARTTPGPNAASTPDVKPVDPKTLVGTWKASRSDGSSFDLTLNDDQTFTWKFTAPKQPASELTGKYTVEQNVLALQQPEGGSLIGQVTPKGDGKFNFKMAGGPPEDPGLDFAQ
jgi:tetratricopeptide (TPR) repeat protein